MQRIVVFALALSACSSEAWLRLEVALAAGMPQPASLRVILDGTAQPVGLGGKALPGSLIVRHLAASTIALEVDGLDASGAITSQASASIALHRGENDSTLTLAAPIAPGPDAGADLAVDAAVGPDLAAHCPPDKLFCDDFESGDISRWGTSSTNPAGIASFTVDAIHALGHFALDARAGSNGSATRAEVEQPLTLSTPPLLSTRFYVYAESNPGPYAIFLGEFHGVNGYAVGIDSTQNWVITQDQATNPDLHSTVVMTYNAWHCVDLVIDYGGNTVELDVDGAQAIKTTPALLTVPDSVIGGLVRGPANTVTQIWWDDVAVALHRIGCE